MTVKHFTFNIQGVRINTFSFQTLLLKKLLVLEIWDLEYHLEYLKRFYFLISLQMESIGFMKKIIFRFSTDLYVSQDPEHNLIIFRKCLYVTKFLWMLYLKN